MGSKREKIAGEFLGVLEILGNELYHLSAQVPGGFHALFPLCYFSLIHGIGGHEIGGKYVSHGEEEIKVLEDICNSNTAGDTYDTPNLVSKGPLRRIQAKSAVHDDFSMRVHGIVIHWNPK